MEAPVGTRCGKAIMAQFLGYAKTHTKDSDYGRRGWISQDKILNEYQLRSHARCYRQSGDMNEFISFCRENAVPEEVIARVLDTVR